MKLARIEIHGEQLVGLVQNGAVTPLAESGQDDLLAIAMVGERPTPAGATVPLEHVRLLAPLDRPRSVRDFLAFEEHVKNARGGAAVDPAWYEAPSYYFSNPAAIFGPDDVIPIPRGTRALDYELEVAAVIGREARNLDAADPAALDCIAGFTILNDWSARDFQRRDMAQGLGPTKSKDFATSLGPYLVTMDEFSPLSKGRVTAGLLARVNGVEWSRGELSDMFFSWSQLLEHASRNATLVPGDVIGSGTCGTGCILEWRACGERDVHRWLREDDTVELEADRLGVLRNTIGCEKLALHASAKTPAPAPRSPLLVIGFNARTPVSQVCCSKPRRRDMTSESYEWYGEISRALKRVRKRRSSK